MQHTLTTPQQNLFTEFCERFDIGLRADYSGRGMMGKDCVGLSLSQFQSPFMVGMEFAKFLLQQPDPTEDLFELIQGNSTDSWGKGTILYFPHLQWK